MKDEIVGEGFRVRVETFGVTRAAHISMENVRNIVI
jgi:hypothetical protein